ncbi:hypothetical protein IAU60_006703 [Kwoniella sp. DSM 27419]
MGDGRSTAITPTYQSTTASLSPRESHEMTTARGLGVGNASLPSSSQEVDSRTAQLAPVDMAEPPATAPFHPKLDHTLVPESPQIDLSLSSPDHRGIQGDIPVLSGTSGLRTGSGRGLKRVGSYKRSTPEPRFLHDPSPSSILALLEAEAEADQAGSPRVADETDPARDAELRTGLILRRAVRWAVERCDAELMAWLVGLEGLWADVLDRQVQALEDEEGWGLLGTAISCSCGRPEREEVVRTVVSRWGWDVGRRGGRDRTGWTPLHLAALISTPPLISFLLSRGASPQALTNRGLTPIDLVTGMPDRQDVVLFLEHATSHGEPSSPKQTAMTAIPHFPPARQAMLERRRRQAAIKLEAIEREERRNRARADRERWLTDVARLMDVDIAWLVPPPTKAKRASSSSHDSDLGWMGYELDLEAERQKDSESESGEEDYDISILDLDANMLVFSLSHLPVILDILVTDYTPVCQPLNKRSLPANALFLHARFALHRCDETWLEELIETLVERIEQDVYANTEDLAYLSFWSYNSTLLLHLLRSDRALNAACQDLKLLSMLEELINAIHVFVIRIAEMRIDGFLDAAILDYETLEDFNDIRYEGEWSLFRSFVPKKKRDTPRVASIFNNASPGPDASVNDSPGATASSFRTPARIQSMSDLRLAVTPRSISHESTVSGTSLQTTSTAVEGTMSPARVTDVLSGVLLILQLYEVNPAVVVQAFSQILYWISCELFNRILRQRKYLCRTKALQIKMNITVLDDWVRANGLPAQTATRHLEPVSQLLQWLQCLSQINKFDMLIGTMQNMKSINPLQLRRAVKDYRYEVNEGKMHEECGHYLAQLQRDWERRSVHLALVGAERRSSLSDLGHEEDTSPAEYAALPAGPISDDSTPIDALFDGSTSLADYIPQSGPECLGELFDSRYMMPFRLPQDKDYLIATPPSDAAYRNFLPSSPFISDGSRGSRPPSRSSFSSSRPLGWAMPKQRKLRELPMDFFAWLKAEETRHRLDRDARAFKQTRREVPGLRQPDEHTPIPPPKDRREQSPTPTPTRPAIITLGPARQSSVLLPSQLQSPTVHNGYDVVSGLPSPALRSSKSIQELRDSSKIMTSPSKTPQTPSRAINGHDRSESFELKLRMQRSPSGSGTFATPPPITSPTLSIGSDGEGGSGGKRKWWKLGKRRSSSLLKGDLLDDRRKVREGSEDTIGPGRWGEDVKTPSALTPSSEKKKFWS